MKTLKTQWGFTLIELSLVLAILAILAALVFPAYNDYKNGPDERLVQICVAEIQQIPEWGGFSPADLRQLAMAYTPTKGVEIADIRLQNTREACFERLLDESVRLARLLGDS